MVNASKSSFMLLENTKNLDYLQDIILNNGKVEHTTSTKLLGLHIQTDLAWIEHITSVVRVSPLKLVSFSGLASSLNLIFSANYILHLWFLTWTTVLLYGVTGPDILIS